MDILKGIIESTASVISVICIVVIVYGTLVALLAIIKMELRRIKGNFTTHYLRVVRADFGTYLLIGLELLIASDILKTIVEPGINELLILGGIVVLRTVLSVFLNKEIHEIDMERHEHPETFEDIAK